MESQIKTGPKEFFLHLLTFGLLYAFAVSFIGLWWQIINIKFPDLLAYYSGGFDQLRWPISILIIVFPVFVLLARMTTQAIVADPAKKESRIYRWLVYLTLFVTAVTVIVDLISLLYNFLGGELTARFGLKVFVVLIVSLGIFGYYLWHLRSTVSQIGRARRIILWSSLAVVVVSIVLAFVIVGSPATARAQKFDQQRIQELQTIQYNVISYWQVHNTLPVSLQDFGPQAQFVAVDPLTEQPYEYRIDGKDEFQLCAIFETNTTDPGNPAPYARSIYGDNSWAHPQGRYCWNLTVNTALYPKPIPAR